MAQKKDFYQVLGVPDSASQDEINAANQQKGKSTAPDVFDLGQSVALANTSMFAPYQVATFDDIPSQFPEESSKCTVLQLYWPLAEAQTLFCKSTQVLKWASMIRLQLTTTTRHQWKESLLLEMLQAEKLLS